MGRPTKNYQKQHHLNQNMVDDTPLIAKGEPNRGKKQGHRVLCCCDSRKGTMLVNLVALIFSIIGLVSASINYKSTGDYWLIVILSISVLFWLSVVWGALRYHRCAVFIAMLWAIASLVLIIIGTVQYDWDTVSEEDKPYRSLGLPSSWYGGWLSFMQMRSSSARSLMESCRPRLTVVKNILVAAMFEE